MMILSAINSLSLYLEALLYSFFRWKTNKAFQIAATSLLTKYSYRLTAQSRNDLLLPFKMFKRVVDLAFDESAAIKRIEYNGIGLFYVEHEGSGRMVVESIAQHVERQSGTKAGIYLNRNNLISVNGLPRKFILLCASFLMLWVILIPAFLWGKRRINISLLVIEVAELIALVHTVERCQIKELYVLNNIEVDAIMMAMVLGKKGVSINFLMSADALAFNSSSLVADKMIITNAYHEEELKYFEKSMSFNHVIHWPPFESIDYGERYIEKELQLELGTIGFYSSGGYMRMLKGDAKSEDLKVNEYRMYEGLTEAMKGNVAEKLLIFLHPIEKQDEAALIVAKEHYEKIFQGVRYAIHDPGVVTAEAFEKADLAISVYSAVLYERLFFGFKSLFFMRTEHPHFPVPGSALEKIIARNQDQLTAMISEAMSMSTEDYFERNGLGGYRYDKFMVKPKEGRVTKEDH
ncbi:MAG: hypothetical protein IH946_06045 [Bacteroidetes bacterium]|nr:hypothetical protein [Bacteroidota bacterium]